MTLLNAYHSKDQDRIRITPGQASRFAKEIAGDFNPIHDPDNKRFCIPGDLLFALTLAELGISEHMYFSFKGLMGKNVDPRLSHTGTGEATIVDDEDKIYLSVSYSGASTDDLTGIEQLVQGYAAFSGQNFPHLLVPLMKNHNVMINPGRPLVVYESMRLDLEHLDFSDPQLQSSDASLDIAGKRGNVRLAFHINDGNERIGHGEKTLVLSNLRPYDEEAMSRVVEDYLARKQAYSP